MNGWLKGWLASEAANQDKIEVKRIYIDLNEGNLYDGVIFSQIMYWHGISRETGKPRMSIERDGKLWLVKGYGDWWEECRIIEPTARAAINRIAKRGLIVKKLWKFNGAPTLHIRMDWESLEEQLMWLCDDISNGFDSKYQIGNDMSYQNDLIPQVKSLTDTTSDTTSESKAKKPRTPSKDLPANPYASEDVLILSWAAALKLTALGIGANVCTSSARKKAAEMLKWDVPATADEIRLVTLEGKKRRSDYPFEFIPSDLISHRAKQAKGKIITGVWAETTAPELPDVGLSSEERKALIAGTKKAVSA